ncbi:MAG: GntR family transcriptional regulator [Betaproteobacteria bacterium]|nr:GntR family transcriptional regulator [Betaproteobacteria bacterium]
MTVNKLDIGLRIRDDIIAGVLKFGERVTMEALAIRYGVSHMPVREALRDCGAKGLVVIEPNRGARIRTIDAKLRGEPLRDSNRTRVMMVRRAAARLH